jgi:hypothetical protein
VSGYQTLTFRITGAGPVLFHNGQLADPANRFSKAVAEITGKRKKTDADLEEVARREWLGGLYVDKDGPVIPWQMLEAAMIRGAMKEKRGPAAKAGLLVERNSTLEYVGPRDPKELWEDERFRLRVAVKVGTGRVMRTRPHFDEWAASVEVKFLPSLLNARDVRNFLVVAGEQVGIGDWRPRFGRFSVAS